MKIPTGVTKASSMTKALWVRFRWEDIRSIADAEPVYLCTGVRDISEAREAAEQFDAWAWARNEWTGNLTEHKS